MRAPASLLRFGWLLIASPGVTVACASAGEPSEGSEAIQVAIAPSPARDPACVAPPLRDCSFYERCLEAARPCGASGYAVGYGARYCRRFLEREGLSDAGRTWRDETMQCLQRRLGRFLDGRATCDRVIDGAFDDHPACYTQEHASICRLPPWDWITIVSTIDLGDLLSTRGRKQIAETAATCAGQWIADLTGPRRPEPDAGAGPRLGDADLRANLAIAEALAEDIDASPLELSRRVELARRAREPR